MARRRRFGGGGPQGLWFLSDAAVRPCDRATVRLGITAMSEAWRVMDRGRRLAGGIDHDP